MPCEEMGTPAHSENLKCLIRSCIRSKTYQGSPRLTLASSALYLGGSHCSRDISGDVFDADDSDLVVMVIMMTVRIAVVV